MSGGPENEPVLIALAPPDPSIPQTTTSDFHPVREACQAGPGVSQTDLSLPLAHDTFRDDAHPQECAAGSL